MGRTACDLAPEHGKVVLELLGEDALLAHLLGRERRPSVGRQASLGRLVRVGDVYCERRSGESVACSRVRREKEREDALGLPSGPMTILFDLRLDDGSGLPFSSSCERRTSAVVGERAREASEREKGAHLGLVLGPLDAPPPAEDLDRARVDEVAVAQRASERAGLSARGKGRGRTRVRRVRARGTTGEKRGERTSYRPISVSSTNGSCVS